MAAIRRDRTTGAGKARKVVDILAVAAAFAFVAALTVGLGPQAAPASSMPVASAAAD